MMASSSSEMASKVSSSAKLPQKRYYRQRAHSNPMADHCFTYPVSPLTMDWSTLYPMWSTNSACPVDFLDLGCGYGGLLIRLATLFPAKHSLGMEIRVKVADYVRDRIQALREQHEKRQYNNVAVVRCNALKHLVNFISKGRLEKIFLLYPDPHFKKAKHKWRAINQSLLAEYAYVLREGGRFYTVTDVEELHDWMSSHLSDHKLFRKLDHSEVQDDPVAKVVLDVTEEGQKVDRMKGQKWQAVFERVADPFTKDTNLH